MQNKAHTWRVEGVVPTESNGRPWNKNINLQAVAVTLEDAVAAVRERYPDIKFIKVMMDRWIEDLGLVNTHFRKPPKESPLDADHLEDTLRAATDAIELASGDGEAVASQDDETQKAWQLAALFLVQEIFGSQVKERLCQSVRDLPQADFLPRFIVLRDRLRGTRGWHFDGPDRFPPDPNQRFNDYPGQPTTLYPHTDVATIRSALGTYKNKRGRL